MTRTLNIKDAINEALHQEMAADERVVIFGEDIAGGAGRDEEHPDAADAWGGPFGVTKGSATQVRPRTRHRHGHRRDGLHRRVRRGSLRRACVRWQRSCTSTSSAHPSTSCSTRPRRCATSTAASARSRWSSVPWPVLASEPVPSTARRSTRCTRTCPASRSWRRRRAYDAKGLLIEAIRDPDPVIFIEHKRLYMVEGRCPRSRTPSPSVWPRSFARVAMSPSWASRRWSTPRSKQPTGWPRRASVGRSHRPAHDVAARSRHHHRLGPQDWAPGRRGRIEPALLARHRHRRPRGLRGLRRAARADRHRDRTAHAGALQPAAGGRLHPIGRAGGGRGSSVARESLRRRPRASSWVSTSVPRGCPDEGRQPRRRSPRSRPASSCR